LHIHLYSRDGKILKRRCSWSTPQYLAKEGILKERVLFLVKPRAEKNSQAIWREDEKTEILFIVLYNCNFSVFHHFCLA